jgi:hypothetical protein
VDRSRDAGSIPAASTWWIEKPFGRNVEGLFSFLPRELTPSRLHLATGQQLALSQLPRNDCIAMTAMPWSARHDIRLSGLSNWPDATANQLLIYGCIERSMAGVSILSIESNLLGHFDTQKSPSLIGFSAVGLMLTGKRLI